MIDENDPDWFFLERHTALLYMSCLAKYLAKIDKEATIPSTSLSLDALNNQNGFSCIDIQLRKILPVPRNDVALPDIVRFKHRRRHELLCFRNIIDEFYSRLAKAENQSDVKDISVSASETLERGVMDLRRLLDDGRIATIANTVKCIMSLKSPALWATIGVTAGCATKIADLPLDWTAAGIGMCGAIEVASHLVDSRNKSHAALHDSPFAYCYHAERDGLI